TTSARCYAQTRQGKALAKTKIVLPRYNLNETF
ncbi:MAG: hypothetical protein ACI8PT_000995, partial [Gammaproteobacteria bacterium]